MDLLVFTHFMNGFLMVALPVGLALFLTRRFRLGWRLWWIGVATFVLSQAGHIPFNWIMTRLFALGYLPSPPAEWRLVFNAVFLGLSAGLFEELARALVYSKWADDARSWRKGVLLGAGHGGIEAIILGALVLNAFVNMLILRGPDAARLVAPEQMAQVQQQVTAYWSASWSMTLLGAAERVFSMIVQIALSLIVLQAFTRRQPAWVALAVLWHAVVDAAAVYFSGTWGVTTNGAFAIEGVIGISALISLGIIFALRRKEPEEEEGPPAELPTPPAQAVRRVELDETDEDLEKSRYSS
jgi:uncharacterized membrane protein YhfC